MNVGSLFSGVGGIELGFEREGFTTKWFVENEPYAAAVLKKRFPEAKVYGDITEIDFTSIQRVDILTGGFPCQPWSKAGKQKGVEDERWLWPLFKEAIRILRPKYALIENVPGLAQGGGLHYVLADLAALGYDAEWYVIPASAVGAPHKRERIFIISYINRERFLDGQTEEQSVERESSQHETKPGTTTTDSSCSGLERERKTIAVTNTTLAGWWATEPNLVRMVHGLPNRAHRIKCLGNAVVPQVAQAVAKAIKEAEE